MAYQEGIIQFRGTDLSITYYRMNGQYHVRAKSSLTGKKFWKHPCFENSRRSCRRFATGNKLASKVYRSLPNEKRQYALFCILKSLAIEAIKQGVEEEDIIQQLQQRALQPLHNICKRPLKKKFKKVFPYALEITATHVALSFGRFMQLSKRYGEEKLLEMARTALLGHAIKLPMRYAMLARA